MPKIIKSAKGTFTTADITVDSSGRVITASTGSAGGTYIAATGGTIHTIGDYKVHQFNSDATFTVTSVGSGSPESAIVDYIVVGGGGGGGDGANNNPGGGGGGGGGYRSSSQFRVDQGNAALTGITVSASPGAYPVTVGAAGTAGPSGASGGDGGSSSFSTITSSGGGGGGGNHNAPNPTTLGSGGGHGRLPPFTAGTGNTPPVSPPMGFDGDINGGGGAMGFKTPTANSNKSAADDPGGGLGVASFILNSNVPQNPTGTNVGNLAGLYLAGGGRNHISGKTYSEGYIVGGYGDDPGPALTNTAMGGNAGHPTNAAKAGGSGVVYIRYRFQ